MSRTDAAPTIVAPPAMPSLAAQLGSLPAQPSMPGQSRQTTTQMQSILTLPPALLAELARTPSHSAQRTIVGRHHATEYLSAMTLQPPSPAVEHPFLAMATPDAAPKQLHSGVPLLLNLVFAPETSGIIAPVDVQGLQTWAGPIYASSDEWAQDEGRRLTTARGFPPEALASVSDQLKAWKLEEHARAISTTVLKGKEDAVLLAAQAAVQSQSASSASANSLSPHRSPDVVAAGAMPAIDLAPYASHYVGELTGFAQGFYPRLHRQALDALVNDSRQSSAPVAADSDALLVRASAVAALTANVIASREMAEAASQTLGNLSQSVSPPLKSISEPSVEAPPVDQAFMMTSPANAPPALSRPLSAPMAASVSSSSSDEVGAMLNEAASTGQMSEEARDVLLAWAHQQYTVSPLDDELVAVLSMLAKFHPSYAPILLLLGCVHFARGSADPTRPDENELAASMHWNQRILQLDPNYVEALSNIGTSLRALGQGAQAEEYWRRAIELRPTYFDAFENLLGTLCQPVVIRGAVAGPPRFQEALAVCQFVERAVFAKAADVRPLRLPPSVAITQLHRVQNLFYAQGNLYTALGQPVAAMDAQLKGLEIALCDSGRSTEEITTHSLLDLVLAVTLGGLEIMDEERTGQSSATFGSTTQRTLAEDTLSFAGGNRELHNQLLARGGGVLPLVLLQPSAVPRLMSIVFGRHLDVLPAVGLRKATDDAALRRQASVSIHHTTSTILLTLAKAVQDAVTDPHGQLAATLTQMRLAPSMQLVLPLYYLALALHPSPSTFNNLGILLAAMPGCATIGGRRIMGPELARTYYEAGLEIDPEHPHLYTNLGSLLKDSGQLQAAIRMYERAVELLPTFDVALANLANAIKDSGRVQDSVQFYRRAVEANPSFPEAICGLVNALNGICDWRGRGSVGDDVGVSEAGDLLRPAESEADRQAAAAGWIARLTELVRRQLDSTLSYGSGCITATGGVETWMRIVSFSLINDTPDKLDRATFEAWRRRLAAFDGGLDDADRGRLNEGGFVIRLIERLARQTQRRWYVDLYGVTPFVAGTTPARGVGGSDAVERYARVPIPPSLPQIGVPTVLPFHTFTSPISTRDTRLISHRNALRIAHSALQQPWLPTHVLPPPAPPSPRLKIGYLSSDFGNHPLAHLMQSVFGLHDRERFEVFCYATSASDNSIYRRKIEREAEHFVDLSKASLEQIVGRISADGCHILVNLNGYTKGARHEVFATRPAPITMQFMGYAGTLAAGWNDYILGDALACPPELVACEQWRKRQTHSPADLDGAIDPEEASDEWMYTEKVIYLRDTYFCTDHKQSFSPDHGGSDDDRWRADERKRWQLRRKLFPALSDDTVIIACANQLYKIDPFVFRLWLNILVRVPKSVLWLLRFPSAGEDHLRRQAVQWAGPSVASRLIFTDVAAKAEHVERSAAADLFVDTTECSAHTTAADILWSGTPLVTFPRHDSKMCSRVGASIARATGHGDQMIVDSAAAYEERAVALASSIVLDAGADGVPVGRGELYELRRTLFLSRSTSPLFDTERWVRSLERGYVEAWTRWVEGTEFEGSPEWNACGGPARQSGCIWLD